MNEILKHSIEDVIKPSGLSFKGESRVSVLTNGYSFPTGTVQNIYERPQAVESNEDHCNCHAIKIRIYLFD